LPSQFALGTKTPRTGPDYTVFYIAFPLVYFLHFCSLPIQHYNQPLPSPDILLSSYLFPNHLADLSLHHFPQTIFPISLISIYTPLTKTNTSTHHTYFIHSLPNHTLPYYKTISVPFLFKLKDFCYIHPNTIPFNTPHSLPFQQHCCSEIHCIAQPNSLTSYSYTLQLNNATFSFLTPITAITSYLHHPANSTLHYPTNSRDR